MIKSNLGIFILFTTVICTNAKSQEVASEGVTTKVPPTSTVDKVQLLEKQDEFYLQRHHPFFFAYNESLSKLQMSFKTPLMKKLPIYFGYTQLMFWDLKATSKPFRDLTYNPELFYRQNFSKWSLLKSIDLNLINHNSNGKAGLDSRSFNRTNIRANFEKEYSRWILSFYIQLSYLYAIEEGNHDIRKYISPYEFGFSMVQVFDSWIDKSEIAFQIIPGGRKGEEISLGGYQASWSFRLGGLDIVPAIYVQYYTGHAETLLNYNSRVDIVRAGLIF